MHCSENTPIKAIYRHSKGLVVYFSRMISFERRGRYPALVYGHHSKQSFGLAKHKLGRADEDARL